MDRANLTADAPPRRRVVFVNRFYYPDESATAQILTDLASDLAARAWEVTVIASRLSHNAAEALPRWDAHRGVRIARVSSTNLGRASMLRRLADFATFYPAALIKLIAVLRRGDVLVAKTDPPLLSVVAAVAALLRRARLVTWLQDLYPEVAEQLGEPVARGSLARGLRAARNWSLRRASANVAIGAVMRRRLAEQLPAKASVSIIPNWTNEADIVPINPGSSSARLRWGYTNTDTVVCYSGNLGRAHEGDTLLAAAELLRSRADIHFLIIGGGAEYDRLRGEAKQRGIARLRFEPHQPREELSDTLAAGDIHWLSLRPELEGLIVPSKFYGILAAGRPLIALGSLDGEISTEASRLKCGLAVAQGDADGFAAAIVMMADQPELRARMSAAGRQAVTTDFAKRTSLDRWHALLSDVAARSGGNGSTTGV